MNLTDNQIFEISNELDSGNKVYIHKTTQKIITFPDTENDYFNDECPWQEDLDEIEDNYLDYHSIEKMESSDSFETMGNFVETIEDHKYQEKLYSLLNKSKPFRRFKDEIENSEYRENWFQFKDKSLLEWTKKQIENL